MQRSLEEIKTTSPAMAQAVHRWNTLLKKIKSLQ